MIFVTITESLLILFVIGPVLSSYPVEDRVQVAEIDPSMIVEYIDDDDSVEFQPCLICGDSDNEELLLLCDGCDCPTHTYCTGLDDIPSGSWYCDRCEVQRAMSSPEPPVPFRRRRHRTRAAQIRQQSRNQLNSFHWARVWQSVRNRLDLDLDFPFDDESASQRRRQRPWEESRPDTHAGRNRQQVPPARYLDIEAPRPSRPRAPRIPTPEPESLEEVRAWNAFERAREIEENPRAARKRREPSPSPVPSEPERKLKRPRTRRPEELAALALQNGESSRTASAQASARINAERSSEPSFLQSLLNEVEEGRANSNNTYNQASNAPTGHTTPGPSSPSISPGTSNNSSPSLPAGSPDRRSISPLQLSSPASYSSPPFSPDLSSPISTRSRRPQGESGRVPRTSSRSARPRADDTSPSRFGLSLTVKSEIQKLVGRALKPHYRAKGVSKDEYTDINRTISRKLYERVGSGEQLQAEAKADLEKAAETEVKCAIQALKQKKAAEDSDAAGSGSAGSS